MDTATIDALIRYIDAAIEAKIDAGDSADGGVVSSVHRSKMEENLRAALARLEGPKK
jgi:hypothetical protein